MLLPIYPSTYLSHTEFHCAYLRIRRVVKKRILARFPRLSGGAQAGLSEPGLGGRVSFWPCQRNLIKTFQNEANTPLITKSALKFFLTFLVEVIRLAELQNSDFQSYFSLSKIIRIFLKKIFIGKYQFRSPTFVKNVFW